MLPTAPPRNGYAHTGSVWRLTFVALSLVWLRPSVTNAQTADSVVDSTRVVAALSTNANTFAMEAAWNTGRYHSNRERLGFSLNRQLHDHERLAFVINGVDVSALIQVNGTGAWIVPDLLPLPSGVTEVVAYLVDSSGPWNEVARFPLRVRNRAGLDESAFRPTADVNSIGQLDRYDPPDVPPPDRRTYQDITLRLGVESSMSRDQWRVTTQANAVGVSEETQRLRYSDLQASAPRIDLADYRVQVTHPFAEFVVGHQTVGQHRLLVNGFGSRGVGSVVRLGSVVTMDASVLNGSNISGWYNPLGFAQPQHRVGTAGIAVELNPSRPGAAQLQFAAISGSLLPRAGFNQAAATDAERSRGGAVRFMASDVDQRVRFEAGYARSRFTNPVDPLLAGDEFLVPVRPETRSARYGEINVDVLRSTPVYRSMTASLSITGRHERVDPQYRTVAAFVQADRDANGVDVVGSLGPLALRAAVTRARDNLQNVPSILTTHTDGGSFAAALPLATLVRARAWYLPTASFTNETSHQSGSNVPVNGGFDPSHVPDQVNTNRTVNLNWNFGRLDIDVRRNNSFQDNRQAGRERADFETNVDVATISGMAFRGFDVSFDLSRERQTDVEQDIRRQLNRIGLSARWQPIAQTELVAMLSHSQGMQAGTEQRTRNLEYQLELSRGFNVYRRLDGSTQGRVFIRYAHARASQLFALQSPFDSRTTWTLNAGASMRLF